MSQAFHQVVVQQMDLQSKLGPNEMAWEGSLMVKSIDRRERIMGEMLER